MTDPGRADLGRPRDLSALLSDATRLCLSNWRVVLLAALVIVVPVEAAVLGGGLNQFSGDVDSTPAPASAFVPALVRLLVVGPLMAVITLHVLTELSEERKPRPWASIQTGLDAFAPVFWPVLLAVLCEVLTIPLIVVPFILLVRFYFVPQIVAREGTRGPAALRASWELTRGMAWRTAGVLLVGHLVFSVVAAIAATPLVILAQDVNSEAVLLSGSILGDVIVSGPIGMFGALLYFDLRSRARARALP